MEEESPVQNPFSGAGESKDANSAPMSPQEKAAEVFAKGFEQTLLAMKTGMEKASAGFEQSQGSDGGSRSALSVPQLDLAGGITFAMKTAEELVAFSQNSIIEMLRSGRLSPSDYEGLKSVVSADAIQKMINETAEIVTCEVAYSEIDSTLLRVEQGLEHEHKRIEDLLERLNRG